MEGLERHVDGMRPCGAKLCPAVLPSLGNLERSPKEIAATHLAKDIAPERHGARQKTASGPQTLPRGDPQQRRALCCGCVFFLVFLENSKPGIGQAGRILLAPCASLSVAALFFRNRWAPAGPLSNGARQRQVAAIFVKVNFHPAEPAVLRTRLVTEGRGGLGDSNAHIFLHRDNI